MKYCVIKNTTTIIDGSDNEVEVMQENALNAGITDFEILTAEEFKIRVDNLPKEPQAPLIEDRINAIESAISMLMGV